MKNLMYYDMARHVPEEAKKQISGGKLKGMTDINPMWRIKILTEMFGACGIGWKYEIAKQWAEDGGNGEKMAFCNILLYIKAGENWSEAIPGTGGSKAIALEKGTLVGNDECYKMALTDAISVAAKALGVGADVYFAKDRTKYDQTAEPAPTEPAVAVICERCQNPIRETIGKDGKIVSAKSIVDFSRQTFGGAFCVNCTRELNAAARKRG